MQLSQQLNAECREVVFSWQQAYWEGILLIHLAPANVIRRHPSWLAEGHGWQREQRAWASRMCECSFTQVLNLRALLQQCLLLELTMRADCTKFLSESVWPMGSISHEAVSAVCFQSSVHSSP